MKNKVVVEKCIKRNYDIIKVTTNKKGRELLKKFDHPASNIEVCYSHQAAEIAKELRAHNIAAEIKGIA